MSKTKLDDTLNDLLYQYWDLAYVEGKEGRDHDTEAGDAQQTLSAIRELFRGVAKRDDTLDDVEPIATASFTDREKALLAEADRQADNRDKALVDKLNRIGVFSGYISNKK